MSTGRCQHRVITITLTKRREAVECFVTMGTLSGLEDLAGLAADMARLEMDRDSCDIVFVVRVT